jgi:heme exporter protein B
MNNNKLFSEVIQLLKRDVILEWKQKYAINGLMLYVVSTVFVCYLSFKQVINIPTWNALFWIIILFTAVNATSKSFSTESKGKLLYYYSLTSAHAVIISRIIYNSILMLLISILGYLFYSLLIGNPVQDHAYFVLGIVLGSIGLSSTLTLVAGIASKTNQNATLMAILSFPIILPFLLILIRFSKNAADGLAHSIQLPYVLALLSLNVIVWVLSILLFPFLWKD